MTTSEREARRARLSEAIGPIAIPFLTVEKIVAALMNTLDMLERAKR